MKGILIQCESNWQMQIYYYINNGFHCMFFIGRHYLTGHFILRKYNFIVKKCRIMDKCCIFVRLFGLNR